MMGRRGRRHKQLLDDLTETRKKCKGIPRQAEVALGVPGRLRPPDLLDFWHYKGDRSSTKRTGRLYPRKNPWYSFSEAESTSGRMVLSEGTTEKIPSDTTGDRSRSALTTTLPEAPYGNTMKLEI